MKTFAILLAAGCGSRFGGNENKIFQKIGDRTMLERSAACLLDHPDVSGLVVVAEKSERERVEVILAREFKGRSVYVISGGASRQESALAGLVGVRDFSVSKCGVDRIAVLIHDAARCFLPQSIVSEVIETIRNERCGVAPAIAVTDTVRLLDETCAVIVETLPRKRLVAMQTPQGADLDVLLEAAVSADEGGTEVTDDLELLIRVGYPVKLIEGSPRNIKITTPDDVLAAGCLSR
ncbi:MAG: 2-C-methyl-D-erythritol 4-phosphate cytidylyltransferase [Clostridiaceae bacterium]|nr:2-C-methyl-D-erythritol 4-phosphate cytidylyltransferase [Clostridiaceae bacterium]